LKTRTQRYCLDCDAKLEYGSRVTRCGSCKDNRIREYQRARQQNMRDINKTVPPKLDGPRGYTVSYLQHLQVPVFIKTVNKILRREAWLA
jgi:hypothetical protein